VARRRARCVHRQLHRDGTYRWAKRFGHGTALVGAYAIAIDGHAIYVAGGLTEAIDFGGGAVGGEAGQFLASFDHDGNYRWARADAHIIGAPAVAVAGAQVYIAIVTCRRSRSRRSRR